MSEPYFAGFGVLGAGKGASTHGEPEVWARLVSLSAVQTTGRGAQIESMS